MMSEIGEAHFPGYMGHDSPPAYMKADVRMCVECQRPIRDKFYSHVAGERLFHTRCLRCSVCQVVLDDKCYEKLGKMYCRHDYYDQFGGTWSRCGKCGRILGKSDWLRKAGDVAYHLACFTCDSCKRQLSTGEEFALHDNKVLCKTHYIEAQEGGPNSDSDGSSSQKTKPKRMRTTFTEEQMQILNANFNTDSNPDGQDLERMAAVTGLTKRVVQVWFQNSRARHKKQQQKNPGDFSGMTGLNNNNTISPDCNGMCVVTEYYDDEQSGNSVVPFMMNPKLEATTSPYRCDQNTTSPYRCDPATTSPHFPPPPHGFESFPHPGLENGNAAFLQQSTYESSSYLPPRSPPPFPHTPSPHPGKDSALFSPLDINANDFPANKRQRLSDAPDDTALSANTGKTR